MNYNLFIDDLREPSYVNDGRQYVVARSTDEAINVVMERGIPDFISFDHDLGTMPNGREDTSINFIKWLVYECPFDLTNRTPDYRVHSDNGPGRNNIISYMESMKKVFG